MTAAPKNQSTSLTISAVRLALSAANLGVLYTAAAAAIVSRRIVEPVARALTTQSPDLYAVPDLLDEELSTELIGAGQDSSNDDEADEDYDDELGDTEAFVVSGVPLGVKIPEIDFSSPDVPESEWRDLANHGRLGHN